ncbi:P-loop containing nucleoside triphosphate hydrolase protein [Favolaschia claudopus]|uniref:P-loop containing nucleoside triphosphate hydrolase protein n=1 Tax=Favolaschia claudopus TaxID=2862362 RepID=A0AAV9ZJ71_9AGAR
MHSLELISYSTTVRRLRPFQLDLVAPILDGDDILCCTATGDGKSAAFSVPLLVLNEYNLNPHLYGDNITSLIKTGTKWQVICVDPEHLQEKEWLDEAHLIRERGANFRLAFNTIGLFFRNFHVIRRSNERLNVQIAMQILTHRNWAAGSSQISFPTSIAAANSLSFALRSTLFSVSLFISGEFTPSTADKFRRVRMYDSLCPAKYNEETIRLMENDPGCQIIVATIALSNGINCIALLDSVLLTAPKTLNNGVQHLGRGARKEESTGRGVFLVQLSSITAATKQLNGISSTPTRPTTVTSKSATPKEASSTDETALAQFLVEKHCLAAFVNKHYSNPAAGTSTLDCIAAKRPLPCSLCLKRSDQAIEFATFKSFRSALLREEQRSGRFPSPPTHSVLTESENARKAQ